MRGGPPFWYLPPCIARPAATRHVDGSYSLVAAQEVHPSDKVLPNELVPCRVSVESSGQFHIQLSDQPSGYGLYDRVEPMENEQALREAVPRLYTSFQCAETLTEG